jgi:hypothetical protein
VLLGMAGIAGKIGETRRTRNPRCIIELECFIRPVAI